MDLELISQGSFGCFFRRCVSHLSSGLRWGSSHGSRAMGSDGRTALVLGRLGAAAGCCWLLQQKQQRKQQRKQQLKLQQN
jgi:hypothetical protein